MQIRTANGGRGHLQKNVVILFEARIGNVVDGYFARGMEYECFHAAGDSWVLNTFEREGLQIVRRRKRRWSGAKDKRYEAQVDT
jgi:hypothetical protein